MIKVKRVSQEIIHVNNKIVSVEAGEIVNYYDLNDEELNAVNNFLEATKRLLIMSTVDG